MARWRLTAPHYLNLNPSEEYSYEETDRETGRRNKQVFKVPRPLDPKDPRDCNYNGEVVVGQGEGTMPKDYIFIGAPTPDMEPLDDAAKAISASYASQWKHPIDSLEGNGGFSAAILADFTKQLADAMTMNKPVASKSLSGVSKEDFDALQEQVAALMARNAELEAKPAAKTARRA